MHKRSLVTLALAGIFAVAIAGGGHAADKPKIFELTSSAVKDGGMLPKKYGGKNPEFKSCTGENVSPALHWSGAPPTTKSYVIMLLDPVGRPLIGVVHWLAYDIPASKTGFKEGEVSTSSAEFKGGKSTMNRDTYFGPCPPSGSKAHPYTFLLFATDIEPGTLKAGMTNEELAPMLRNHVVASTSLVARYGG